MNNLIGKKVVVISGNASGEKQDIGILQSVDDNWVCVKKSETDTQYFSIHNIRIIKAFES